MLSDIECNLEGFGMTWKSGQHLVDVEVTLGQNEKSSNCTITLSDPTGEIAAGLINHSIKSGGIQQLPGSTAAPVSQLASPSGVTAGDGNVGVEAQGAAFTPQVKAFLDLIALREVGGVVGYKMSREWYFIAINGARFTEAEAQRPNPPYERFTWTKAAGRYQIIPKTWDYIKSANPGKFNNFMPEAQDRAALWLMRKEYRNMTPYINAGNIRQAISNGRNEWTSLPGAAEQQAGWTVDKALAYYEERLRFYQGGAIALPVTPKVEPEKPPEMTTAPEVTQDPIKGNKIIINWGEQSFEFYHQGTEWNENGITTVTGQGIRWVLNRRKRNKTVKGISLKQLATKIAAAHKVKLDWQATIDPTYEHIDQSGISDYQLLVREASFAGLFVSEEPGTLTVKSRDKIKDTGIFITKGINLVSYTIADKALDPNNTDNAVLAQDEPKTEVEPVTGKMVAKVPDIDIAKAQDTTGKQTKEVAGKPTPGQDAVITQNRVRMKRIKGLPSNFVITLSLGLKPLDAIRTKGFPEPLDRIWMIDKVTHVASKQTTKLEMYSPVEVIDNTPVAAPGAPIAPQGDIPVTPGDWVYPASGVVTSVYGLRGSPGGVGSRDHKGADIGCAEGVPQLAAGDGVAEVHMGFNGGAGNWVGIRHTNGYFTRHFHLNNNGVKVTTGQQVRKGQVIALTGTTGNITGAHAHFEVFPPGAPITRGGQINPAKIFPKLGQVGATINGGTAP